MQHVEASTVGNFSNNIERKPLAHRRDRFCVHPAPGTLGGSIPRAQKCDKVLDVAENALLKLFQPAVGKCPRNSTAFESMHVFVDRTEDIWATATCTISRPRVCLANIGSNSIDIVKGRSCVEP